MSSNRLHSGLQFGLPIILLVIMFQNCSSSTQFESLKTSTLSSTDDNNAPGNEDDVDDNSPPPTEPPHTEPPPTEPPAPECRDINHISVYRWTNLAAIEADPIAIPTLGSKLFTMEIDLGTAATNVLKNVALDAGIGWRFQNVLSQSTDGTSRVTTYVNKFDEWNNTEIMTCYFGPRVVDSSQPNCYGSTPPYINMGVGLNGVNGLIGHLSCPLKYIACKVEASTKGTQFLNMKGTKNVVPATQPFVIKRGCGL